jgi:hypothetical protein
VHIKHLAEKMLEATTKDLPLAEFKAIVIKLADQIKDSN